jgi:hypothetical protein
MNGRTHKNRQGEPNMNGMHRHILTIALICALAACSSYRDPKQQPGMLGAPVAIDRSSAGYDRADAINAGIFVPNASGGMMLIPGKTREAPEAAAEEAVELKLRARELAAQLLETHGNQSLLGLVALPTSFLDLDDFTESSPFGRYLGEAMFYEFNQREFPVREYRLTGKIVTREGTGELALSRALPAIAANQSWAALLVGTYQRDAAGVFVNARLIRPADGMVLRTAQLVLPMNNLLRRMIAGPPLSSGSLRITAR